METEVLRTPDGDVIIMTNADYIDVIRKYISDEFAESIERQLKIYDEESHLDELYFNSDYKSMEESCDAYTETLNEVIYLANDLDNCLDEKKLNRKKLSELVTSIKNICSEVL